MLGRKDFTEDELRGARTAVDAQIAAYRNVVGKQGGGDAEAALCNALLLGLDRRFVHRLRSVTGKAGTPLNEAELLVESLLGNAGVLRENNVINYVAEESVLGLKAGDRIALTIDDFSRLADAMLEEIDAKYVT